SQDSFIQQLTLKIISITPHNIGCERMFSVLGWMCLSHRS
ncbi:6222_t:CDS:1, partial [Funneliformis geosporum]